MVARNYHCTSGNVGYRHVFYVLAENGHADAVVKILKNPEYPGWGYMIASGATSVWERWESKMTNEMHSFNHPMYGSYDAFLYKFLGGIDVSEDAFGADKLTVAPVFADGIDFVETSYKTVRGKLEVKWQRSNAGIGLDITVPPTSIVELTINGEKRELKAGRHTLKIDK